MKTDKPFQKSFACAAILFAGILISLVAVGGRDVGYRIGYMLASCIFPALVSGTWGFLSKKSWSWVRFAITVGVLFCLFRFLAISGQAQR